MENLRQRVNLRTWCFGWLGTFFSLMLSTAILICIVDACTPNYVSNSVLDLADGDTVMSVYGVEQPDENTVVFAILSEQMRDDLALAVSNSTALSVWQDDEPVYVTSTQDAYQRVQVIPLVAFSGSIAIRMTFSTQNPSNRPTNHVLLGTLSSIQSRVRSALVLNTFFLGMLAMMLLSSAVLYLQKRSESYLLYLFIAAALSLVSLYITFSPPNDPLSFIQTYNLRAAFLAICQWHFLFVLVKLYNQHVLTLVRRLSAVLLIVACMIAIGTATGNAPAAVSYFYRLSVAPVAAVHLADVLYRGKKDALLVFIAYATMEGICLGSYFAADRLHYGTLFGFFRVVEVAQAGFLIMVTGVVNFRFAHHFNRSEALQRELSELNATLEAKVEERTRDLKEQQRRRQTTMQNIFHDLRSPLTVLRSQVDRMEEDDPIKKGLTQRLSYMQRLTEELFFVSNLESHNVIFDEDDVDITALAEHVAHGIKPLAAVKQVKVTFSGVSATVWGDALRLEQAIQNLAGNALHHVNDGGDIRIAVAISGQSAVISVCNTGSTISDEDLPFVFERYYRSRKKHDPHSSGLGLSIAKEIVQAHEGSITVKSLDVGETVFTISIPLL